MFIRQSKSRKNGKEYSSFQIANSYRDENNVVRQETLLHLGPANKFLEKDVDNLINGLLKAKGITTENLGSAADEVKSFGQIWAFLYLWKELKISQVIERCKKNTKIEFDIEKHIQCLVFNRLDDPCSKLKLLTWLEQVHIPNIRTEDIRYEYLLRSMDFLVENKNKIEDSIAKQILHLFNSELTVCFYDLTSTYFEAESSITDDDIRRNGYSRDMRSDREQIVIGVVMSSDGIPLSHYVFPGNTSDRSTLQEVMQDICKRYKVNKVKLIADKGLVSGDNLKYLISSGKEFILGDSAKQTTIAKEVIQEADASRKINNKNNEEYIYEAVKTRTIVHHKKMRENIELRYVSCYNPEMAMKRFSTRTSNISKSLEALEEIQNKSISVEDKYSKIKELLNRKHLGRFFRIEKKGDKVEITKKEEALIQEEKSDGWFMVITTDRSSKKEAIIEQYKDLKHIEHCFYELKHSLDLRPNHHWTKERIKGHVMICFISYQLSVLLESRLKQINLSWERSVEKLRRQVVIIWNQEGKTIHGLTKTNSEQTEIYTKLGVGKPTLFNL